MNKKHFFVSVTGIPVPGATIQIQDVTTGTIPFWGTTTTDASGFYSLSFAPGSWNLIFTAPQGSGLPDHTENNLEVTQDLNFDIDLLPQPESVVDLTCTLNGSEVNLSWVNAETYSSISVLRNGTLIASLSGTETTFNDSPGAGIHQWSVIAILDTIESLETNCSVSIPRARQRRRKAAGTLAAFSAESAVIGEAKLDAAKIASVPIMMAIIPFGHK